MASSTKVTMLSKGYAAIRRSKGVTDELVKRANRIAEQARSNAGGKGDFQVAVRQVGGSHYNSGRVRVTVFCADAEAMRAEAEDRALTRAFQAGGG